MKNQEGHWGCCWCRWVEKTVWCEHNFFNRIFLQNTYIYIYICCCALVYRAWYIPASLFHFVARDNNDNNKNTWCRVFKNEYSYIRNTSSQFPGMIRYTYATMGTYTITYSSWYIHKYYRAGEPGTNIVRSIYQLVPQPEILYQPEIPVLAWTFPVQLEEKSRASSTNSTRFWTRAEVGGAAK